MFLLIIIGVLWSCGFGPLVLAGVVSRALDRCEKDSRLQRELIAAIAFFSYPLLVSWVVWISMLIVPGQALWLYMVVPVVGPGILAVKGAFSAGKREMVSVWRFFRSQHPGKWLSLLLIAGLATSTIATLTVGFHANDSMEYQLVADEILKSRSYENYPLSQTTEEGLYVNASHPPGFHALLVWSKVWQPEGFTIVERFLEVFYLVGLCVVVFLVGTKVGGRRVAGYAVFGVLACPIFLDTVYAIHTDPQRIFFYAAAIFFPMGVGLTSHRWVPVASGFVTGLAMFTHSIGILALPAVVISWVLSIGSSKVVGDSVRWRRVFVVILVACCVGSIQFGLNFVRDGVLLADHEPVLAIEKFDYKNETAMTRGISSFEGRMLNGGLRPFIDFRLFGYSFLAGIIGAFLVSVKWIQNRGRIGEALQPENVLVVLCFFWLVCWVGFSWLNIQLPIKNVRYLATPLPLFALLGGVFLDRVHEKVFG